MKNLNNILSKCKKGDRKAQKELYDYYSPLFFAICKRYIPSSDEAEDAMLKGFFKIFTKISNFKDNGSFEGWMKRIMINESLMLLRQTKNFNLSLDEDFHDIASEENIIGQLEYQTLLASIELLPVGYRTVFNMHVIEGYKHREIAEILQISINTSKSQLIQAKKKLQVILKKKHLYKSVL